MTEKAIVSTQIRLPVYLHEYIKQEADRLGIAQNSVLVMLLDKGRKVWEAEVRLIPDR